MPATAGTFLFQETVTVVNYQTTGDNSVAVLSTKRRDQVVEPEARTTTVCASRVHGRVQGLSGQHAVHVYRKKQVVTRRPTLVEESQG